PRSGRRVRGLCGTPAQRVLDCAEIRHLTASHATTAPTQTSAVPIRSPDDGRGEYSTLELDASMNQPSAGCTSHRSANVSVATTAAAPSAGTSTIRCATVTTALCTVETAARRPIPRPRTPGGDTLRTSQTLPDAALD